MVEEFSFTLISFLCFVGRKPSSFSCNFFFIINTSFVSNKKKDNVK